MTRDEIKKVFVYVNDLYPNVYDFTNQNVRNIWGRKLLDYEYKTVTDAIDTRYCMDSLKLNFADLIDILNNTSKSNNATPQEIYAEVYKLIGKYGAANKSKAYGEMTETAKSVVDAIGWHNLCTMNDNDARWAIKETLPTISERTKHEKISGIDPKTLLKTAEMKLLNKGD